MLHHDCSFQGPLGAEKPLPATSSSPSPNGMHQHLQQGPLPDPPTPSPNGMHQRGSQA